MTPKKLFFEKFREAAASVLPIASIVAVMCLTFVPVTPDLMLSFLIGSLMLIVGMKNTKTVPNPHTAENLAFGAHLQQALHTEYAGLMRPLLLADARYNQQLTSGMVLVEVGTDVNTLEEACYSAELLGKSLAKLLKEWAE